MTAYKENHVICWGKGSAEQNGQKEQPLTKQNEDQYFEYWTELG